MIPISRVVVTPSRPLGQFEPDVIFYPESAVGYKRRAGDATPLRFRYEARVHHRAAVGDIAGSRASVDNQQQQPLGAGGQTVTSPLTNTGTICQEEMVATFCNVASSPNTAGYGSSGGAAATGAGITTPSPSIPTCAEGIVTANELCN